MPYLAIATQRHDSVICAGLAVRLRIRTSMVTIQEPAAAAPKSADGFGRLSLGALPGKVVSRPKIQIWLSGKKS